MKRTIGSSLPTTPSSEFELPSVSKDIPGMADNAEENRIVSVFEKWAPQCKDGSSLIYDEHTGLPVLQVNTLPSFIQAVGYPKHIHKQFRILYRGQTELYDTGKDSNGQYRFLPSIFREGQRQATRQKAAELLKRQIDEVRKSNKTFADAKQFSNRIVEALLQQYGLKTKWIDAVDNVWVALWFACYKVDEYHPEKEAGERPFIHMIRRDPRKETTRFAYILLLKGQDGAETEMVDLRCEIPSLFIRPHIQHGLLVRKKHANAIKPNMVSLIQEIIRIKLEDALEWLGTGRILTPEMMMPNPNFDWGFRKLLESERKMTSEKILFPIYC